VVKVFLAPKPRLKKLSFEFDFSELTIKGRGSQGNVLTKYAVRKIVKREEGISTLGAMDIWYDETVKRLNTEERGKYLGAFKSDDRIITIQKEGYFKLMSYELTNHFDEGMMIIQKFDPEAIVTAIYFDSKAERFYVKRFSFDEDATLNKKIDFIGEQEGNYLLEMRLERRPQIMIAFAPDNKGKPVDDDVIDVEAFIGVKSAKAKGKRLTHKPTRSIQFIEPLPYEESNQSDEDAIETSSDDPDQAQEPKANMADNRDDAREITKADKKPGEHNNDKPASQMTLEFE
jgi:topoisomerase-4 subunit A